MAAVKLHIRLAHVESGLRSFKLMMPEEHNRVLTDHCADLLFCPTQTAIANLAKGGIEHGVYFVGDTMYDAILHFAEMSCQKSSLQSALGLTPKKYILATIHRPLNTDSIENLHNIFSSLTETNEVVILPLHPRTRAAMVRMNITILKYPNIKVVDPQGYLEMLMLEQNSRMIVTDSGGIQKEAYLLGIRCITLREETEWVETVEAGWNCLTGADSSKIATRFHDFNPQGSRPDIYGDGHAADKIIEILKTS